MTLDEQLQAAMLISGNFEGSDPWANITGNIDEEGLTCGQLGKTVKSGDLQEVMQMYLADNTTDSVLSLMPQTGNEYLRMIKLPAQQALNVVIPWSNGRSRVRDPYGSELAAFWKCAGMVACQKAHAATHEGKNVPLWLADWTGGAEGSFHAYALLFDIATQGGSMRGVDRARVNAFLAQGMDAAMASIISWCRGVDKGLSGAVDARRNADLWEAMLPHSPDEVKQLLALAYLRAQVSKPEYVADVLNRKGTLAMAEGFVHGSKWTLEDKLGLADPIVVAPMIETDPTDPVVPEGPEAPLPGSRLRVMAHGGLNLRSSPSVSSKANILTCIAEGSLVRFREACADDKDWWAVTADVGGSSQDGFMAAGYLVPLAELVDPQPAPAAATEAAPAAAPAAIAKPPVPAASVVAVDLHSSKPVTRDDTGGRVFLLNEPGAPVRDGSDTATKIAQIDSIISWLAVDRNARYLPTSQATYCNIYAYDFAHLCGAYLPRVWWTDAALVKLSHGQTVVPVYQSTVDELTANDLLSWFRDWGQNFGWRGTADLNELQDNANAGGVSILVARNNAGHGHITAIVSENAGFQAARNAAGQVLRPVQSQAGSGNFQRTVKGTQWWKASNYTAAMWMHA